MKILYISIMFIVLLTLSIFQAPIFAQSQQNSSALSYQECQNRIGNEMQKTVDSINKTKVILLAIHSNEFQSKINGYRYVYSDIFTNMTEDQNVCGDVKLTSIVVEFSILNGSSNFVKFIQVGEDPQISKVTLVEDVLVSNCDNSCPPPSPPAGNVQNPLTSPLRQIASGVSPKDVKCRQDLTLIFRTEDNFPACVKSDTVSKLIERGWGTDLEVIKVKNANASVAYRIDNGRILEVTAYGLSSALSSGEISGSSILIVSMNTASNGTLIITMPRMLVDAKSNNHDDTFTILSDGQEIQYTEISKTIASRTLSIPFQWGAKHIEVIGYGYYNKQPPPTE